MTLEVPPNEAWQVQDGNHDSLNERHQSPVRNIIIPFFYEKNVSLNQVLMNYG